MTQEDKDLLLRDLCARLPWGAKGIISLDMERTPFIVKGFYHHSKGVILHLSDAENCYITDFIPYLRPMESMTQKESDEFEKITENLLEYETSTEIWNTVVNWLDANHFDHCGLIPKGLALPVPEGMYNEIKEK